MSEIRSEKTKQDFIKYLEEHPGERFWQSVRNWSGYGYIMALEDDKSFDNPEEWRDTFYLEGKNHVEREAHKKGRAMTISPNTTQPNYHCTTHNKKYKTLGGMMRHIYRFHALEKLGDRA